jgi:HlyD family secretion protein
MKKIIINIENMTDSREVYMSKPSPWITGFVYALITMIIGAVIYACIGKIDIYSTAVGVIRPNDDVATVTSMISGKIRDVYFFDGQYVNEGDVLFTIDVSENEMTLSELENRASEYEFEKEMLTKYLAAMNSGTNPFDSSSDSAEYLYYITFEDYILNVESGNRKYSYERATNLINLENMNERLTQINYELMGLYSYKNSILIGQNLCGDYPKYDILYRQYEANLNSLTNEYVSGRTDIQMDTTLSSGRANIDYYDNQITGYNRLINSISNGSDCFPSDDSSSYRMMYMSYLDEIAAYEKKYADDSVELENAIQAYKNKLLSSYIAARDELISKSNNLQIQLDSIKETDQRLQELDDSFNSEMALVFLKAVSQTDAEITSLELEKNSIETSVSLYDLTEYRYDSSVTDSGAFEEISLYSTEHAISILNRLNTCEDNIMAVRSEIDRSMNQINQGVIVASRSGFINMAESPVVGDVINAGSSVATIIPANESGYRVQMYVGNSDIAGIKAGDEITYDIAALPRGQYGIVDGTVLRVSGDTIMQNGEYSGYYLIEGSIPDEILYDRDGNEGKIGIGMRVTARIVTERKTIMRYLLEKAIGDY